MKNNIEGLKDREWVWQFDMSRISNIAEEYHIVLFATSYPRSMERVLEAVEKVVIDDMAHLLSSSFF